jgi:hypothetical protein
MGGCYVERSKPDVEEELHDLTYTWNIKKSHLEKQSSSGHQRPKGAGRKVDQQVPSRS